MTATANPLLGEVLLRSDPSELFRRAIGEPDPWQTNYLRGDHRRVVLVTARQCGKSASTACSAVHFAWTHPATTTLVIAPTQEQSSTVIDRARAVAAHLPEADRPKRDSRTRLQFDNDSKIQALPGDKPSSPRGYTAHRLIVDEAGWLKAATWEAALPTLSTDGTAAILSTPNGRQGVLWDVWSGDDPTWTKIQVPGYESSRHPPDKLDALKRDLGEARFAAEYLCEFSTGADSYFHPQWLKNAGQWGDPGDDPLNLFGGAV